MPTPNGPLAGYRVIDLTSERGAFCTRLLAGLGAEVIKVEPPDGDPLRGIGPFKDPSTGSGQAGPDPEGSLRFASLNPGKKSITLDLRSTGGGHLLDVLLRSADVLVQDADPGTGLDDASVREAHPQLVHTSITGFGLTGPRSSYKGPDLIALAMGGIHLISGEPERPPCTGPETQAYYIAGMHACWGTLVALFARPLTGRGQLVDISVQDCVATEEHQVIRYSLDQHNVRREGNQHGSAAPGKGYPARDGWAHLYITHGWPRFVEWMGSPDALSGEAWNDARFRRANIDVINMFVTEFLRGRHRRDVVTECQDMHMAVVPLNAPAEAADDPHMEAIGLVCETEHPVIGRTRHLGPPWSFSRTPAEFAEAAPLLGQHNAEVLAGGD